MTEKKATPRKSNPRRVAVVNKHRRNGPIGAQAKPLEKDVNAWLAKGWVRLENSAGNAE
ncbi:MAG: hypothetical protein JXR13_18735 [Thalassovita sp.]